MDHIKKWPGQGEHRKAYWRYGVKVEYRGITLRSMLEREFVEYMEMSKGLVFGETLLYEQKDLRITWIDKKGKKHSYTPDFYDKNNGIVYELKHSAALKRDRESIDLKNIAAIEQLMARGLSFELWTERTLAKAKKLISG